MRFDPASQTIETVGIPDAPVEEHKDRHVYVRRDAHYALDCIHGMEVGSDGALFIMVIYPQLIVAVFPRLTAPL